MNVYKNDKSGLMVTTGKIKSISDDRMVMVITTERYDSSQNARKELDITVVSGTPYEDNFKVGYTATAIGYQQGINTMTAEDVLTKNEIFETQELTIVSGLVKFARLNEEKNADGSPKMKKDGVTPKKPHYDVTISVNEGGKYVDHVIRVYDNPVPEGKKTQKDRVAAMFSKFDKDNYRIRATFVTTPGQTYTTTNVRDNKEYVNYGCTHMGFKSVDIEYLDADKQMTQVQEKPTATPVKEVAQPQNNGTGFEAQDFNYGDDEEMFK